MPTLSLFPEELEQDPRTPITGAYQGKRLQLMTFEQLFDHAPAIAAGLTLTDCHKILNECRKRPDPADVVDFSEVEQAITNADTLIDHQARQLVPSRDANGEPDWNPAEHIPADHSVMYQKGWVCNSQRAAIKTAYEKQLHEDYNKLF